MARHIGGDNGALAELYRRYHGRIFLYCRKMAGSEEAAEDIVQAMWERVARLRGGKARIEHPLPFLLKIARNLTLNRFRSEGRFTRMEPYHEPTVSPASDATETVNACLASLSEEHREVIVLSVYCGYRLEEIAEMLGKSHDAIRKRSSRAQARLRELVVEMIASEGRATPGKRPDGSNEGDLTRS